MVVGYMTNSELMDYAEATLVYFYYLDNKKKKTALIVECVEDFTLIFGMHDGLFDAADFKNEFGSQLFVDNGIIYIPKEMTFLDMITPPDNLEDFLTEIDIKEFTKKE